MTTVLLTGASGVVGQAIIEALAERPDVEVIALANRTPVMARPGLSVAISDVTTADLGLTSDERRRLAATVDVVVHSAAVTDWGLPDADYRPVNVDGTDHVVRLAQEAGAELILVSTAFVPAVGPNAVAPLGAGNIVAPYLRSKVAGEKIARSAGLPLTIVRPSNLVGHEDSGRSVRKQIVQHVSEWMVRGRLPVFPAHPGNLLDILPVNTVGDAVAAAVTQPDIGGDLWLTAGARALTCAEGIEVCRELGRARGFRAPDVEVVDPRVDFAERLAGVPTPTRVVLQVLADVSEVVHACGGVLPSSLDELERDAGLRPPDLARAMRRSLEHWATTRPVAS